MSPEPILVYADGLAVDPRALLLARATLDPRRALAERGTPLQAHPAALRCPISDLGTLSLDEVYRDSVVPNRGYRLPRYQTGVTGSDVPPSPRYEVKLELTPEGEAVGCLRVRLLGSLPPPIPPNHPPPHVELRFGTLPDGRVLTTPTLLRGDEFPGIRLSAVPQGPYCAEAHGIALIPPHRYANGTAGISSASPTDPVRCNTVPIEIVFAQPVRSVTLKFCGAAVVYTLRAFDAAGQSLGQADCAVPAYTPGAESSVSFSCSQTPNHAATPRIHRVLFGHFGTSAPPLVLIQGIAWETAVDNPGPTEVVPLPHHASLSLRYLAAEAATAAGAQSAPVSTWKTLAFDDVRLRDNQAIEAVAYLRSLPELDRIHYAMSHAAARCQLVVHCTAELAVRNLSQVFIPKSSGQPGSVKPSGLRLLELPSAAPLPAELLRNSRHLLRHPPPNPDLHIPILHPLSSGAVPSPPPTPAPRGLRADSHVLERLDSHRVRSLHVLADSRAARHSQPLSFRLRGDLVLPGRFFADQHGDPAYTTTVAALDQQIPFFFDPALHGYMYPPRPAPDDVGLIRYAVTPDQVIFQDAAERHLFYYLPDEFRLARDGVRSPTFKPSLQVAFFSLAGGGEGGSAGGDAVGEYGVHFTFRAVPYLAPERLAEARRYIQEHALLPVGQPISLLPLTPEWSQLSLVLPAEGGGSRQVDRPEATLIFDRHVVDSLTLSSSEFAEVFSSMQVGGATLNGVVKFRLPGSAHAQSIPLCGRLDKLEGPVLCVDLLGASSEGRQRVRIQNGIESPVTLRQAAIYLLTDPEQATWALAPLSAASGERFPLAIASGESVEVEVQLAAPLTQGFGARIVPTQLEVNLDFTRLWQSVMETPGWDDITQHIGVSIDDSYFSGTGALDSVKVLFNQDEASVTLRSAHLHADVQLIRPFLPYLLQQETADDYFYRVESYRRTSPEADPVMVAQSAWARAEGAALTITPPLP